MDDACNNQALERLKYVDFEINSLLINQDKKLINCIENTVIARVSNSIYM